MHSATRQVIAGILIYFTAATQVFGQAALLPNAEQQYFNNNGQPLASGSVTYYVPGTTTKKTTWTNAGQTVNNTNPVNLDIGGKGIMYGQGSYRQVVQDSLGNIIWDQPTTAYGASQPSGATGTDTAPVGTVMAYGGFVVPTNWALAYGQALSRTTFATLMAAITIQATGISCTNTSTTLTGFVDTSLIRIGAPIEATCLPTSTTVASITNATTIVVSQAAAATSSVTATIFPWGNGDQVSTFNVPDLRGRAPVGADCMGFVASGNACGGNLTTTFYGTNPGGAGQKGGTQNHTMILAELVQHNHTITDPGHTHAITDPGHFHEETGASGGATAGNLTQTSGNNGAAGVPQNTASATTGITINSHTTGITINNTGSSSPFTLVNPDVTFNYIIKVTPNSTGAGGVVSFGGMFGDIVCDSTLTCAPVAGVNTAACTPATTSQLGCVEPDGVTTVIAAGKLTAIAGVASSIGIGSTNITSGTNTNILYDNAGLLGQIAPSGTGSVCMTISCVMVTPTLGAATATTINGNSFTPGSYTLAGASGKTLTFNNTLTLAGIDATTLTFQGTDTYVGRSTTDTLTNKTINGASNTLTVRLASDVTGFLPFTNLPAGTSDTVIGYWGGVTVSAIAVNNCSNALTYSTTTHTFGCNSSAGTGTVITTGSPTSGQLAVFSGATSITGVARSAPTVCQIITTGATTCNNGGSAANNGTYTVPAGALYLKVKLVGAGGGGAGSGSTASGGTGGAGTNTTFSTLTGSGGSGGADSTGVSVGGAGGAASGGILNFPGGGGASSVNIISGATGFGGIGGGSSCFNGSNNNSPTAGTGVNAVANTGGGGSGAYAISFSGPGGAGGGAGGCVETVISSPSATYSYTVGAKGSAGTAGTSGLAGGAGADGMIVIEAYFN